MGAYDKEFKEAQDSLKTLTEDPGNQTKLEIYALFKQVIKCYFELWFFLQ